MEVNILRYSSEHAKSLNKSVSNNSADSYLPRTNIKMSTSIPFMELSL